MVTSVSSGSPAAQAGIATGDVITSIDNATVSGASDLVSAIRSHRPGDKVKFALTRNGASRTVTATHHPAHTDAMSVTSSPTRVGARPVARQAPPRRAAPVSQRQREWIALGLIVAGGVAVLTMWLQDTPAGSLRTLGDELTAAGRLTGLVGTYLVLVQVLLMARFSPLERMVGMDRLARWHSRNGQYVVSLLVVHAVATIAGYALADHLALTTETSRVVLRYPDVLAATVALGLLVAIGVTSARAARRRLLVPRLVLRAPVRLPGGGPLVRPSAGDGQRLRRPPAAPRVLDRPAPGHGRPARGLPPGHADLPGGPPPSRGGAGHRRRPGRRVHLRHRSPPRRARRATRPVLHLALPHPPGVVAGPPVLAVGRAQREAPARHREGGRRLHPRPVGRAAGHARDGRRTVRRADRPPAHAPQGAPAGGRHRGHAAAGPVRVATGCARRPDVHLPGQHRGRPGLPRRAGGARRATPGPAWPSCSVAATSDPTRSVRPSCGPPCPTSPITTPSCAAPRRSSTTCAGC